jgi:hypothetical protein
MVPSTSSAAATSRTRRRIRQLAALASFLLVAPLAAPAGAADFPLVVELARGQEGEYGTVSVQEDGAGGLAFEVSLDVAALGSHADLRTLYLNLLGAHTGLYVETADPVPTLYTLELDPGGAGAAGARFDGAVHFGKGRGPHGNGVLQHASFTLVGDEALSVEDLLPFSATARGLVVQMAVRVQGVRVGPPSRAGDSRHGGAHKRGRARATSVTVGGVLVEAPEAPPDGGGGCPLIICPVP